MTRPKKENQSRKIQFITDKTLLSGLQVKALIERGKIVVQFFIEGNIEAAHTLLANDLELKEAFDLW